MASCCCRLLYRLWLSRPLVYRCLLTMTDAESQRRRLTTRQGWQPVTTPRHWTTSRLPYNLRCSNLLPRGHLTLLLSQLLDRGSSLLHHRGTLVHRGSQALQKHITGVLHDYVCCPSWLHQGFQVFSATSYYTEAPQYYPAPSYTLATEPVKYYPAPTFCPAAAPSYYVDPNYYTTIYAAPGYYTEALLTTRHWV
jgi:hypothetical protein